MELINKKNFFIFSSETPGSKSKTDLLFIQSIQTVLLQLKIFSIEITKALALGDEDGDDDDGGDDDEEDEEETHTSSGRAEKVDGFKF